MTPEEARIDGIRSYELAIKTARQKMLEPTNKKLWAAIKVIRKSGLLVRHVEGDGIAALWNVGPLNKLGYFEMIRLAQKVTIPRQRDASMTPLREWPDLPPNAFK